MEDSLTMIAKVLACHLGSESTSRPGVRTDIPSGYTTGVVSFIVHSDTL